MSSRMIHALKELGFLAIFVAVIALVFQQSATDLADQGAASGDAFSNSALFPEIVAALMALACGVIAVNAWRAGPEDAGPAEGNMLRLLAGGLVVLGYIAVFRWAGFYISTALAAGLLLLLFKARSPLAVVLFPIGVTLVIGYTFEILFQVVLPLGVFELTLQPFFR